MVHIRVIIVVRGPTKAEVTAGLPGLLDEFKQQDLLTRASASWDASRGGLAITIECESQDATLSGDTILDEVRDCVVACLESSTDICYDIVESSFTSVA
jgi:hypothetical protein